MLPVIAEVVGVGKRLPGCGEHRIKLHLALVFDATGLESAKHVVALGIQRFVNRVVFFESMKVRVVPFKQTLDDLVQPVKANVVGHGDDSPNQWLSVG